MEPGLLGIEVATWSRLGKEVTTWPGGLVRENEVATPPWSRDLGWLV